MASGWGAIAAARFAQERPNFRYRYVVTVTNSAQTPVHVDIFHPGDKNKWLNGQFGILVLPEETKDVAVPDWSWMAWGGPFRVLNHIQDHPLRAVIHRDLAESSAEHEVKPWSTITVGEADVVVAHGDPGGDIADHESDKRIEARGEKWAAFVAKDTAEHEDYAHKYFLRLRNESDKPIAADVLVSADAHKMGGDRKIGFCGWIVMPEEDAVIVIPDFSWMAYGGPRRVLNHIQNHPVELCILADGKDEAVAPLFSGSVTPGALVRITSSSEVLVTADSEPPVAPAA